MLSIQHFRWALVVSLEDLFSKARDLHIGSTRVVDMVIVGPLDLPDLVQVLLAAIAVRVQDMVVRDYQPMLVILVAKSIRDHVICLREHASDVDRLDIILDHVLIGVFSSSFLSLLQPM